MEKKYIRLRTGKRILTHNALGISFREWSALFATWGVLAHNMLPATRYSPIHTKIPPVSGAHLFDMGTACAVLGACGTVGCIGGNMALAMGMEEAHAIEFVYWSGSKGTPSAHRFKDLFFPSPETYPYIGPEQAAEAIWNFLRTGDPQWQNINIGPLGNYAEYRPYTGKVKAHHDLNISFSEWMALIGVRVMLDSGALKMVPKVGTVVSAMKFLHKHSDAHVFHIGNAMTKAHCGTVGCIGGYMGEMMGKNGDVFVKDSGGELNDLFYPPQWANWNRINNAVAVRVIDNFLTTGKANWEEVLAA